METTITSEEPQRSWTFTAAGETFTVTAFRGATRWGYEIRENARLVFRSPSRYITKGGAISGGKSHIGRVVGRPVRRAD